MYIKQELEPYFNQNWANFTFFTSVNTLIGYIAVPKKAPKGLFLGRGSIAATDQSRSPPAMPNSANRLWNTFITLRYRPSVALM